MLKYLVVLSLLALSASAKNQQEYMQQYPEQHYQQQTQQQYQQQTQQQYQQQSQGDSQESQEDSQSGPEPRYQYKLYKLYPLNRIQVEFLKKFAISSATSSEYRGQPPVFLTPFSPFKTAYALIPNKSNQKIKDLLHNQHVIIKPVDTANIKNIVPINDMHVPSEFPKSLRQRGNSINKMAQAATAGPQQDYLIESPRLSNWGVWGDWAQCPDGEFVVGMRLKTEWHAHDESALNAIKLICAAPGTHNYHEISSLEGPWGDWGHSFYCPGDSQVSGFQLRSEPAMYGIGHDNSAANNLRILCNVAFGSLVEGDGNIYGYFTEPQHCLPGQGVRGFRTQVEPKHGGDESALNNVDMACADIKK